MCACGGGTRTTAHCGRPPEWKRPCGWPVEWNAAAAEEEDMSPRADRILVLFLIIMTTSVRQGSALRCYKCSDYTGRCENVHECTYEDACLTLSVQGGKTVRQCIRYTDCDNSRLSQMFPAVPPFSYRCCNNNLCNSSAAPRAAPPAPLLLLMMIGWLLSAPVFGL